MKRTNILQMNQTNKDVDQIILEALSVASALLIDLDNLNTREIQISDLHTVLADTQF